jgi:hypothetical protein
LIPLGLNAALVMTLTQALLARGASKLILRRAIWTFCISATFTIPMLQYSATHVALVLSLANIFILGWFLKTAFLKLSIHPSTLIPTARPILAGLAMLVAVTQTPLPLIGRIAFGTAIYLLVLTAFQFTTRPKFFA